VLDGELAGPAEAVATGVAPMSLGSALTGSDAAGGGAGRQPATPSIATARTSTHTGRATERRGPRIAVGPATRRPSTAERYARSGRDPGVPDSLFVRSTAYPPDDGPDAPARRLDRSEAPADRLMVRMRLLALPIALALAAGGCTVGSGGPGPGGTPVGGGPAGSGRQAHCDALNDAVETVRYHLQLMVGLNDAEAFAAARESDAPFRVDPVTFRRAVEVVAVLSGVEGEIGRLRRLATLLEQNLGIEDPFRDGSTTGAQMLQLAEDAFAEAQVVLDEGLRAAGCPVT
jgi:hypothetical protein